MWTLTACFFFTHTIANIEADCRDTHKKKSSREACAHIPTHCTTHTAHTPSTYVHWRPHPAMYTHMHVHIFFSSIVFMSRFSCWMHQFNFSVWNVLFVAYRSSMMLLIDRCVLRWGAVRSALLLLLLQGERPSTALFVSWLLRLSTSNPICRTTEKQIH